MSVFDSKYTSPEWMRSWSRPWGLSSSLRLTERDRSFLPAACMSENWILATCLHMYDHVRTIWLNLLSFQRSFGGVRLWTSYKRIKKCLSKKLQKYTVYSIHYTYIVSTRRVCVSVGLAVFCTEMMRAVVAQALLLSRKPSKSAKHLTYAGQDVWGFASFMGRWKGVVSRWLPLTHLLLP